MAIVTILVSWYLLEAIVGVCPSLLHIMQELKYFSVTSCTCLGVNYNLFYTGHYKYCTLSHHSTMETKFIHICERTFSFCYSCMS